MLNKTNLNTNFITNIRSEWSQKIATTTWKVGGNTSANIRDAAIYIAYQNEIIKPSAATTYEAKIGLIYVSDYGYAANPTYWTYVGYNSSDATKDYRAATTSNWMNMGNSEWTISRTVGSSNLAFRVDRSGLVFVNIVNNSLGVRPSFNLLSSITYVSGSGTQSDPIIIN